MMHQQSFFASFPEIANACRTQRHNDTTMNAIEPFQRLATSLLFVALLAGSLYRASAGVDTDRDGIPDSWESSNGLKPLVNDANEDVDGDGLTNLQECQWSLANTNRVLNPRQAFTFGGSVGDYEIATGVRTNRFYYDNNNRLIGGEYANGLVVAYVYDGNNNLVRQVYSSRLMDTNNLPLAWRLRFGLTGNNAATADDPNADPDGDGWSNYHEFAGGGDPTSSARV
jgi:YD repeat-containing protein